MVKPDETKNICNIDWIGLNFKIEPVNFNLDYIRSQKSVLTLSDINNYLNTDYQAPVQDFMIEHYLTAQYIQCTCESLLNLFCEKQNNPDLKIEYFKEQKRGVVRGFSNSYAYNSSNVIVFSYNKSRLDMGVNLQITGQGCKLVYFQEFREFILYLNKNNIKYRCNRLDIAYDDFDKVIPVKKMVNAVEKSLESYNKRDGRLYYSTRIRRDSTNVITNHFNGQTTKNLLFGKHSSIRSFRLYDKRAEQKIHEIDYWYRFEIELHSHASSQVANDVFNEFIEHGLILRSFYEQLQTIIRFMEKGYKFNANLFEKNGSLGDSRSLTAGYWSDFLEFINNQLRIICIMRS